MNYVDLRDAERFRMSKWTEWEFNRTIRLSRSKVYPALHYQLPSYDGKLSDRAEASARG